jgi:hypothetical protein
LVRSTLWRAVRLQPKTGDPTRTQEYRFKCATRLFPALDALQLVERDFVRVRPVGAPCTGGRSYVRARHINAVITRLGQTL